MARTSFGPGNVAIRSERYRYIHYHDGTEEFYDHSTDPHEWNNQVEKSAFTKIIEEHRAALPQNYHRVLGGGSTSHETWKASAEQSKSSQ